MPDEFLHAVETMVWNFGDGSAPLTIVQAAHIYTAAGTYDVSVTVNDIETVTRTIKIDTIPMSPLMEPMERKRRWVGWAKGTALEYGGKYFAVDSAIDSSFSMSINVNASSVYFFYGRFLLSTVTASTLTFRQCDYPGKTLVYYHENDSMVYTNIWSEPNRSGSFVIHTVK